MNLSLIRRLGLALALTTAAAHALADDSIEQLRAENARLRAQLQQLQQSCPVAAAAPASAPASKAAAAAPSAVAAPVVAAAPAPPAAPAPVAAAAPVPASAPVPAPAAAAVQVQPAPAAASPAALASVAVPEGYKLVPLATPTYVDPMSPPYDRAGCSRNAFQGPPPAKWNDAGNWEGMRRGLSMTEVTDLLGKEHFDSSRRDRVEWDYGKCGDAVGGRVQFVDGQVVYWQTPAF